MTGETLEKSKLSFERIRHLTQVAWDGKRGSLQTEGQPPNHGDRKGHGVLGNHGKPTCSPSAQGHMTV